MDNFWTSNWGLKTEANLVMMRDQVWFYQVDPLSLLGLANFVVKGLERASLRLIQKELPK